MAQRSGQGCIYKRGSIWWIKLSYEGKQIYESSGSGNREDAVQLLRLRQGELSKQVFPSWLSSSVTMDQILELVPHDLKTYQRRDVRHVERQIKLHLGPEFAGVPVKRLSTRMIQNYIQKRKEEKAANASINRELATLRRALRLALEQDPPLIGRIFRVRLLPEDNIRMGFIDQAQYLRLREMLPPYQQLALVIGYHTGIRRGELLSLQWSQVDLPGGRIILRGNQTKSGHSRVLPIYGDMRAWLEMAKAQRDKSCPENDRVIALRCKKVEWFYKAWRTACDAAGMPGLLFHDLRRTAVRNMLDAGIDEKTVMLITGHRTRNMIDRYNIRGERDVMRAAVKLEEAWKASQETVTKKVTV